MSDHFFGFDWAGEVWLKRARTQLKLFDEGSIEALFYAAFALRMGIEARLHEYLRSAAPDENVDGYTAKTLLQQLQERSPHAQRSFALTFRPEGGGSPFTLTYSGISDALVKAYGRLGDFLHASFFTNNRDWAYRMRLRDMDPPSRSLLDVRDELEEVATELDKATRGTLLGVRGSLFENVFDK